MEETRTKIISSAEMLFFKYGIRSVTMDDVARELSISKKTLYQYFDNKDHLVLAVAQNHLDNEQQEFSQIRDESQNAIEEISKLSVCMRRNLSNINPTTMHDLKKFHSEAWNQFLKFKYEFIKSNIVENIKWGVSEGYYRDSIDAEILAIFRMEQVEMMFDQNIYPSGHFDFSKVQIQLFVHFVYGILTHKGRELYEKFQLEEANNTIS
jgi:AcrR family transcriptional regulator